MSRDTQSANVTGHRHRWSETNGFFPSAWLIARYGIKYLLDIIIVVGIIVPACLGVGAKTFFFTNGFFTTYIQKATQAAAEATSFGTSVTLFLEYFAALSCVIFDIENGLDALFFPKFQPEIEVDPSKKTFVIEWTTGRIVLAIIIAIATILGLACIAFGGIVGLLAIFAALVHFLPVFASHYVLFEFIATYLGGSMFLAFGLYAFKKTREIFLWLWPKEVTHNQLENDAEDNAEMRAAAEKSAKEIEERNKNEHARALERTPFRDVLAQNSFSEFMYKLADWATVRFYKTVSIGATISSATFLVYPLYQTLIALGLVPGVLMPTSSAAFFSYPLFHAITLLCTAVGGPAVLIILGVAVVALLIYGAINTGAVIWKDGKDHVSKIAHKGSTHTEIKTKDKFIWGFYLLGSALKSLGSFIGVMTIASIVKAVVAAALIAAGVTLLAPIIIHAIMAVFICLAVFATVCSMIEFLRYYTPGAIYTRQLLAGELENKSVGEEGKDTVPALPSPSDQKATEGKQTEASAGTTCWSTLTNFGGSLFNSKGEENSDSGQTPSPALAPE